MVLKRSVVGAAALWLSACGGGPKCVARGARVRVRDGERNIEDISVGDEIITVDVATQASRVARVSAIAKATRECVQLRFGGGALMLTSDHPVYCPVEKVWAPAGDWALGKRTWLLQLMGASLATVEVTEVSTFAGVSDVFDLTVDDDAHTFVANGVVVHNKSFSRNAPRTQTEAFAPS